MSSFDDPVALAATAAFFRRAVANLSCSAEPANGVEPDAGQRASNSTLPGTPATNRPPRDANSKRAAEPTNA